MLEAAANARSTDASLWETRLPASGHASPMTYLGKDGRQYVAIAAGGGKKKAKKKKTAKKAASKKKVTKKKAASKKTATKKKATKKKAAKKSTTKKVAKS